MFTGLIEESGTVAGIQPSGEGKEIVVSCSVVLEETRVGDSISINGACQTVTSLDPGSITLFASRVTLERTTLGQLSPGDPVNLERALTPSSRMGGHIVQGHVDGTGTLRSISRDSRGLGCVVESERDILRYIVPRGSVAVDGISLTVVSSGETSFELYIIPETLAGTSIDSWQRGQKVNIEVDILAKYVERMLSGLAGKDDEKWMDLLGREGFI
jgi:riboflavin synthase